jgi:hypothetical protein
MQQYRTNWNHRSTRSPVLVDNHRMPQVRNHRRPSAQHQGRGVRARPKDGEREGGESAGQAQVLERQQAAYDGDEEPPGHDEEDGSAEYEDAGGDIGQDGRGWRGGEGEWLIYSEEDQLGGITWMWSSR